MNRMNSIDKKGKPIHKSRTLAGMTLAAALIATAKQFGIEIDTETAIAILTVLSWIFRLITKEPVKI